MAWAYVQSATSVDGNGVTSVTVASPGSVTAGHRILVVVGSTVGSGTAVINTPTDSQGNTYTQLLASPSGTELGQVYSAVAVRTGANTVTCTAPAATGLQLGASTIEFSGLSTAAGTGCLDVTATGSATGPTTPTGTTLATHAANQLALAAYTDWGEAATLAPPTGFTKDTNASRDAANYEGACVAYKSSAAGATEGGSFTGSNNGQQSGMVLVVKLAGISSLRFQSRPMLQAVNRSSVI